MSRIAKKPIPVPEGVKVELGADKIKVTGSKGTLEHALHKLVKVNHADGMLTVAANEESKFSKAMSGTMRANLHNIVHGVSTGFQCELELIGVGYRTKAQGNKLELTLGFSHPVVFELPQGVKAETPKQTTIVLSGCDKQQLMQAAADIRSKRPPENYKGKGIRYAGANPEYVEIKETKKK